MSVPLKEVAREAGVSTATVSNVVNNSKFVTDETRGKVVSAIKKLNFHPNPYAQMLALGRSNLIGLVVSDIANPFFSEIIKAVEAIVFKSGYSLLLFNSNYEAERGLEFVNRLLQMKAAGILLMCSEPNEEFREMAAAAKTSFVFYDPKTAVPNMNRIHLDYAAGIDEAVKHLVLLGHRKIAHISGTSNASSALTREKCFVESVRKYLPKAPKPRIYSGDFKFEGGQAAAKEILRHKKLPSAVVVANDFMALGAMAEFKSAGLRIPHDISIVGFDDISLASISEPALTTISSRPGHIGQIAMEMLIRDMDTTDSAGAEIWLPTQLIERGSTTRPNGNVT